MTHEPGNDSSLVYDRDLLLFGARRAAVLDLWEVQRYGVDSFGDADYVSVYGMRPADWHSRGIRLLGRTAVECTRDVLAEAIAGDVARVVASAATTSGALVIDPFIGSGNTLYWILRRVPGARGRGYELDPDVFRLTRHNLMIVASPIEVANVDYTAGVAGLTAAPGELVIVFIAPPWGDALHPVAGLDLRHTTPPVAEIVDELVDRFPASPLLLAVQVFERVDPQSLAELDPRCRWLPVHIYDLNDVGQKHGLLLGTRGWTPG